MESDPPRSEGALLRRIDHIGVVVDDLDQVSRLFSEVLGMALVRTGGNPARGVRTAFFGCGDGLIELIEVQDPEARARRLGQETARIEHIAIEALDLEAAARALRAKGITTATAGPVPTGYGLALFTEPASTGGLLLQLIERRS